MTTDTDALPTDQSGASMAQVVAHVRAGFDRGLTRPLNWRQAQLDGVETMLREGAERLTRALETDLGKPATEAWITEIGSVLADVAHTRSHLSAWTKPHRVSIPLVMQPGSARILAEPLGTVLVLAPWDFQRRARLVAARSSQDLACWWRATSRAL